LFELKLRAIDGDVGCVTDLIFDEGDWAIHAMVADTGGWLIGRRVAIDPDAVLEPDLPAGLLPLDLTQEQVREGPPPRDASGPESMSNETPAWSQANALSDMPDTMLPAGESQPPELETQDRPWHLRNLTAMLGSLVTAEDEPIGKLAGFLVDPIAWDLPIALIDLEPEGCCVLMPTRLIAGIDWDERIVYTLFDASVVRNAPVYDPRVLDERVFLPAVADYYSARV
jgi:hypothetical protein